MAESSVEPTEQQETTMKERALSGHQPAADFADVSIRLTEQRVLLRTSLHVDVVLELLESTGCRAVLQGVGTASWGMSGQDFAAGVAQLDSHSSGGPAGVQGVVRILQPDDSRCVFDGTVDGLSAGQFYSVEMRRGGDLSGGLNSCGPVFGQEEVSPVGSNGQQLDPCGLIGRVQADPNGRLRFSLTSRRLQLWNLVGRCLSISQQPGAECSPMGSICAAGIVARSAGLFANEKRICSCDGVEIWNERDVPSAGASRAAAAAALKANH